MPAGRRRGPSVKALSWPVGSFCRQCVVNRHDLARSSFSGLTLRFSGGAKRRPLEPVVMWNYELLYILAVHRFEYSGLR
jgi:hypothetical protein